MAMKSLANFLSSKKKTQDKLQQSQVQQQQEASAYAPRPSGNGSLHPRSASGVGGASSSRSPSPNPSMASTSKKSGFFSSSATQSSGFYAHAKRNNSTVRLQDSPSLPSHPLSRLFFRSAVDVSRVPNVQPPPQQQHALTANARRAPSVRVMETTELGYVRGQPVPRPSETAPMMTMASKGKERAVGNDTLEIADPFASHYLLPSTTGRTTPVLMGAESPFSPAPVRRPTIGSRSVSSSTQQQHHQRQRPPIRPRATSLSNTQCPPIPPHVLGPLPPVPKFPPITMPGSSPGQGGATTYGPIPHPPPMQITQSAPAEVTSFAASRARSRSVSSGAPTPSASQSGDLAAAYISIHAQARRASVRPVAPPPDLSERPSGLSYSVPASSSSRSDADVRSSGSGVTMSASRPMSMRVPQLDLTWERFLSEAHEDGKSLPSWTSATMDDLDATTARITGAPGRPLPPPPPPVVEPLIVRRRSRAQTLLGGPSATPSSLSTEPQKLSLPANARFVDAEMATMTPPISPPLAAAAARQFFDFHQVAMDVVVVTPPDQVQSGAAGPQTKAEAGVGVPDVATPGSPDTASSLPYLNSVPVAATSTPEAVVKQQKKFSLSSASMLGWDYSRAGSEMSLSLFPKPPSTSASLGMGVGLPLPEKAESGTETETKIGPKGPRIQVLHELPTPPVTPSTFEFPPSMMYTSSGASQSSATIRAPPPLPPKSIKRKSTAPSEAGTLSPSIKSEARSSGSYLSSMDHPDDLTSSSATTVCSQRDPDCSFGYGGEPRSSSETDRSSITPQTAQKARVASGTLWPTAGSAAAIPMLAMPSLGTDTFSLLSSLDFGPASLSGLEAPVTPAKTRLVRQLSSHLLAGGDEGRTLVTRSLPRSPGSLCVGGVQWGQAL